MGYLVASGVHHVLENHGGVVNLSDPPQAPSYSWTARPQVANVQKKRRRIHIGRVAGMHMPSHHAKR